MLTTWALLLAHIKRGAPEAHIAGGAPRDYILGRAIKDLDVFVSRGKADAAEHELAELGYVLERRVDAPYFTHDPLVHSANYFTLPSNPKALPVNLIVRNGEPVSIEENLKSFDFGLCRIAYDGNKLIQTGAFCRDVEACHFSLLRVENCQQYFLSKSVRYPRLLEKYPGWPLVIPAEFEKFNPDFQKLDDGIFD